MGHVKKSTRFIPGTPIVTKLGTLDATLDSANHLQVTLGTNTGDICPLVGTAIAAKNVAALQAIDPALLGGGYSRVTVRASGAATISGVLPDGRKFTAGGTVADNQSLALYASIIGTAPKGTIAGELAFADITDTDFTGEVAWSKPAQTKQTGLNFDGVDTVLTINGCALVPNTVLVPTSFDVNLIGANYAAPVSLSTMLVNGKATPVAPMKSLSLSAKNSGVTGTVVFPPATKSVRFNGVYLPKSARIWGFIKGDTAGGRIEGLAD